MTLKNRIARTCAALSLVGLISSQIPLTGTTAYAFHKCTNNGGNQDRGRGNRKFDAKDAALVVGGVALAYGLYELIAGGRGGNNEE